MANEITKQLPQDLMVIALLRGSFVFTADLIRAFYASGTKPQVDFMTLDSYGSDTTSKGSVTIIRDITENVEGRDVLLVDDILESGRTLSFAKKAVDELQALTQEYVAEDRANPERNTLFNKINKFMGHSR